MNDLKLVRISNITNVKNPPGFFLDFAGALIGAGKHAVVDLSKINQEKHPGSTLDRLQTWVSEGKARVVDAGSGAPITVPEDTDVTPGTRFNEVASSQLPASDAEDFEEDFDPSLAKEADMPHTASVGAHAPNTASVANTKVSLSGEEPNWDNSGTSPIPGAKPRYVDDSEQFSVRAPRAPGLGGVVGK
jgi:hypothetical protein